VLKKIFSWGGLPFAIQGINSIIKVDDMKQAGVAILIAGLIISCDSEGSSTKLKLDSIGKKFDSVAGKTWDSTREKAEDLKEKIENKLEQRDSAHKKADTTNKP